MRKRVKNLSIGMLVSFMFLFSFNVAADDVTDKVTIENVILEKYINSTTWQTIINGSQTDENAIVNVGDKVRFNVQWSVSEEQMKDIKSGDTFEIILPTGYFSFKNTNAFSLIDNTDNVKIGEWQVSNGKIKVEFNDKVIGKLFLEKGYFNLEGVVKTSGGDINDIIVGGIALPPITIGQKPELTQLPEAMYPPIYKSGVQYENDTIIWDLFVNFDNAKKAYSQEAYETLENVVITDDLSDDQAILEDEVYIFAILYKPTSDGKMSNQAISWIDLTSEFSEIEQSNGDTYDSFHNKVKSSSEPAYGIFNNNRLIVSMPSLPSNQLKLPFATDGELSDYLDEQIAANRLKPEQKQAALDAYRIDGYSEGMVMGLEVRMVTKPEDGSKTYSNTAKLSHSKDNVESNVREVAFQQQDGGISSAEPGKIKISKLDGDNQNKLNGVEFKLLKNVEGSKDYEQHYIDDKEAIVTTDENGEATFSKLSYGKYKLVETKALNGYSIEKIVYDPSDVFEISKEGIKEINIEVLNFKDKTYQIQFTKINKNKTPLKGAEFKVTNADTKEVVATKITSNKDGFVKLSGLSVGKYLLEETKAPKGYRLLEKPVAFEIKSSDKEVVSLKSVVNYKLNKKDKLPITGTNLLYIALGLFAVAGVNIVACKLRKIN